MIRAHLLKSNQTGAARRHRFRPSASRLEPRVLLDASPAPDAWTPAQIRHAYGIDQIQFTDASGQPIEQVPDGKGQTIAIVAQGDDPNAQSDLDTFDAYWRSVGYSLPDPPSFTKVAEDGSTNYPENLGTGDETALDIEWAHVIAPAASIVLVEAGSPSSSAVTKSDVNNAFATAVALKASVVSYSYGSSETTSKNAGAPFDFSGSGVTFVNSSGDNGAFGAYNASALAPDITTKVAGWPAVSPDVLAVGGTSMSPVDAEGDYPSTDQTQEVGWSFPGGVVPTSVPDPAPKHLGASGGGISTVVTEPPWQTQVVPTGIDNDVGRAVPDVAWNASGTGYDVYDSAPGVDSSGKPTAAPDWHNNVGGTSASAPEWAGLIAIIDQGLVANGHPTLTSSNQTTGTMPALYSLASNPTTYQRDFHDITAGNNGFLAGPGYDLVTGLGTPIANNLVTDLINTYLVNVTPAPIVATPQIPYAEPVATVSFPMQSTTLPRHYMVTVNWGDGSQTGPVSWDGSTSTSAAAGLNFISTGNGSFSVVGSHPYSALGFFTVTVTLNDGNGYVVTSTKQAEVVTNTLLRGHSEAVATNSGLSFVGVVATFTDADPADPVSNYTVVINWGNGTYSTNSQSNANSLEQRRTGRKRDKAVIDTSATVEQISPGKFAIMGANNYADAGTYRVVVTIESADGASAFVSERARMSLSHDARSRATRRESGA
jgi:subtilase family serine protease